VARAADREDRSSERLDLDLLGGPVGRGVGALDELARQIGELASALGVILTGGDEAPGRVDDDGGEDVRGGVDEPPGDHHGQNSRVPLARISWIVTVCVCLLAAVLLLLNGYSGYAGVLVAVGAAAAVNTV
jgi:hypothetical protein